jgi:hypothetical protein
MARGSLTVVGTGIQAATQLTPFARLALEHADEALYLVNDPVTAAWIVRANPSARSLEPFYEPGKDRREIYEGIVVEVVSRVRGGLDVCFALYGHPGVFAWPGHEAIRRLRAEGFQARMLPGISTEDSLVADLGIDPSSTGCQSYEATDFLVRRRTIDTGALLILWQVGLVGEWHFELSPSMRALPLLVERLLELYPAEHETILYEASPYPVCDPEVQRLPLAAVKDARPRQAAPVLSSPVFSSPRAVFAAATFPLDS